MVLLLVVLAMTVDIFLLFTIERNKHVTSTKNKEIYKKESV